VRGGKPTGGPLPDVGLANNFPFLDILESLYRFAGALDPLLAAPDARTLEASWTAEHLDVFAWDALDRARAAATASTAHVLAVVDQRLLALLERTRGLVDPHFVTFRVPELERWQHATAVALTGARWGQAGLHTVATDTRAPLARRYYALLALAERHPPNAWPLFERYLRAPDGHYAFVALAAEAARYYPGHTDLLLDLFDRIRGDELCRSFFAPKILASLTVLADPASLPLLESLLIAGHTHRDPRRCEVTRALVAIRKVTGRIAPSVKYPDPASPSARAAVDAAERRLDRERNRLVPVTVI